MSNRLESNLQNRKSENRLRSLLKADRAHDSASLIIDDELYTNFSSNDYLGLSHHSDLINRSVLYAQQYGAGSSSSRLITGSLSIHQDVEEKLARLFKRDRALLFNTGFQANATILPALTDKNDLILADKMCHNSMIQGCLASRAELRRFRHNDLDHLEHFLNTNKPGRDGITWIVTESLFSMDGDFSPLTELVELSKKFNARLYVDDAHAFGVYGSSGLGLAIDHSEIDVVVGTFGKAAGSFGAFIVCDDTISDTLINFSAGFIYTTALPPSTIGAIDAALDLIPKMGEKRSIINKHSALIRQELKKRNYDLKFCESHIIPVIVGSEKEALDLSKTLHCEKIIAVAIRPPTVPEKSSRIRLSVTADHTEGQINKLFTII